MFLNLKSVVLFLKILIKNSFNVKQTLVELCLSKLSAFAWNERKYNTKRGNSFFFSTRRFVSGNFPNESDRTNLIECFHSSGQRPWKSIEMTRKCLYKERVQLPHHSRSPSTCLPLYCFGKPIWLLWRHTNMLYILDVMTLFSSGSRFSSK